jgi:hypothetical protein
MADMRTRNRNSQTSLATVGREELFLLRCAAAAVAGRKRARTGRLDATGLDWKKILRLADANRVVPLLAAAVVANRVAGAPESVADDLRNRFRDGAHHAMKLASELKQILFAFDQEKIRCIPLKGPVLAAGSYRSLGLRDFDDLDLLVAPADAPRAADVLSTLGFSGWEIPNHRVSAHLATECEHNLVCAERGVIVDLHWAIYRRYFTIPMDFQTLWRRARRVDVLGSAVPDLSAEDALLFLCFHGGKHLFHRLAWVCDIAAAIAANLNWEALLATATRAGARRLVLLGLYLAERLLGTELPDDVRRAIDADRIVRMLASQVIGVIFQKHAAASEVQQQLQASLFHLRVRERLSDRVRYCFWALAPNARDWSGSRLPAALSFLHVLSRPIRLLRKNLAARLPEFA